MAVLDSASRNECVTKFVQAFFVGLRQVSDLTTPEIRTLVDDLDTWLDSNQTSANNAITAAVRGKASSGTKFAALAYVALRRAGVL